MSFYFNYACNRSLKNRLRRWLITAACAGAVAFTAMCAGYLGEFSAYQQEQIKNISQRQLVVTNNTAGAGGVGTPFSSMDIFNKPLTEEEVEAIRKIDGVEVLTPVILFPSFSTYTKDFIKSSIEQYGTPDDASESTVVFENQTGKSGELKYGTVDSPGTVWINLLSYPSKELIEQQCTAIDEGVEEGLYISQDLALDLRITPEDLDGLTLSVDLMVPICRRDIYGFVDDVKTNFFPQFYVEKVLEFPVRGICRSKSSEDTLFLSAETMREIINESKSEGIPLARQYVREGYQEDDVNQEVIDWAANTYYVIAKDLTSVQTVREEIAAINPNFAVIYDYQDIQAGTQIISNNRSVMVYISLAVLAVVFLLTALVYVSLIDKRKYEFALLRANGLTKREVRGVIYAEMVLQFALIFVVGLLFAALIYFIGGRWLGYPFQFDGMTVLWLFLISLGAIVLPTVISLLFVNRFEPDQVMRN